MLELITYNIEHRTYKFIIILVKVLKKSRGKRTPLYEC